MHEGTGFNLMKLGQLWTPEGDPRVSPPVPWPWPYKAVRLRRADLSFAFMNGADLAEADLSDANLIDAHLDHANLVWTTLVGAHFDGADLSDACLEGADLRNATFRCSTLADCTLGGQRATLIRADLSQTKLDGTIFSGADLSGAIYEPKVYPKTGDIADAANLHLLTYAKNPQPLFDLRKRFRNAGLRSQERAITYAIKRREAETANFVERWFNTVLFDWTCQYGMNPGRPLRIWIWLLVVSSVCYFAFIQGAGNAGIYRIDTSDEAKHAGSSEILICPSNICVSKGGPRIYEWIGCQVRVTGWAVLFSLMSSFNLGVKDVDIAHALRLLTQTEFDLKAKGWARTTAGVQAVVSTCLMTIWAWSYFGRPFQ
jgi:uncharacterized protein YjbI with pentapeptide repeats